ncbi:uncharacterized protein N7479_009712 [Penicillium vulpinum]|nr:uncharacterized protein N7479_009712 [Penicillium vulpinum]KAJ5951299.1 hypothetical protein N7479_009712 [Penicillium vulpinum]
MSDMPYETRLFETRESVMFPIMSSLPTWKHQENITAPDHFNMSTASHSDSSFTLSGEMYNNELYDDSSASWNMDIDMLACNTSKYYGNWSLRVSQSLSYETRGWSDFVLPNMTVDFNTHAANLTMDGDFAAAPYLRSNNSGYPHSGVMSGTTLQGPIQIRFQGVLDAYNSDILDVNSTSPAWLRTVGFGNNSLNIANSLSQGCRLRSALWSALVVPILLAVAVHM